MFEITLKIVLTSYAGSYSNWWFSIGARFECYANLGLVPFRAGTVTFTSLKVWNQALLFDTLEFQYVPSNSSWFFEFIQSNF